MQLFKIILINNLMLNFIGARNSPAKVVQCVKY